MASVKKIKTQRVSDFVFFSVFRVISEEPLGFFIPSGFMCCGLRRAETQHAASPSTRRRERVGCGREGGGGEEVSGADRQKFSRSRQTGHLRWELPWSPKERKHEGC